MIGLDRTITLNGKKYNIPGLINEGIGLVIKGFRNAFDQEATRCLSQEDISQAAKMINRLRQLELLSDELNRNTQRIPNGTILKNVCATG